MTDLDKLRIPDITDVLLANKRITGKVRATPLEYSHSLSQLTGGDIYLKLENQQHAGSFKIRGAMNKMFSLSEKEKKKGVITASSGNHAQGLATAANMLETRAVICVPLSCPETKKTSVKNLGGEHVELRVIGAQYDETEREALRMASEEGLSFVSAYEDTHIAAGQGTLAIEMLMAEPELDMILCPLSGGGLITGVAVASKALRPNIELFGTMAENNPSWPVAWERGAVEDVEEFDSIADALGGSASKKLFTFIRRTLDGIIPSSEEEIKKSMALVHRLHHIVIEGGGATSVAALVSGRVDVRGKRVGLVISGGNVDDSKFVKILEEYL